MYLTRDLMTSYKGEGYNVKVRRTKTVVRRKKDLTEGENK